MDKGKQIIKVYYDNAPTIVEAINHRQDASEIYNELYDVICQCVSDVQEKKYQRAFWLYVEMVIKLRNRFIPTTKIPAFFYPQFIPGSSR